MAMLNNQRVFHTKLYHIDGLDPKLVNISPMTMVYGGYFDIAI